MMPTHHHRELPRLPRRPAVPLLKPLRQQHLPGQPVRSQPAIHPSTLKTPHRQTRIPHPVSERLHLITQTPASPSRCHGHPPATPPTAARPPPPQAAPHRPDAAHCTATTDPTATPATAALSLHMTPQRQPTITITIMLRPHRAHRPASRPPSPDRHLRHTCHTCIHTAKHPKPQARTPKVIKGPVHRHHPPPAHQKASRTDAPTPLRCSPADSTRKGSTGPPYPLRQQRATSSTKTAPSCTLGALPLSMKVMQKQRPLMDRAAGQQCAPAPRWSPSSSTPTGDEYGAPCTRGMVPLATSQRTTGGSAPAPAGWSR